MNPLSMFLVIELGNLKLSSATPPSEVLWFLAGLLVLGGLSTFVLWWNRRGRRDPFI